MTFISRSHVLAFASFAMFVACALLIPRSGIAQLLYGTLSGNVTDASQATIPDSKVVVTELNTGLSREEVSNSEGTYTFSSLPPGSYTITISAPGFERYVKTGVVVNANEQARADASLSPGSVNATVTVQAQAATLQTDRADVHTDLSSELLGGLPMPVGRNYQQIIAVTTPGVSAPQSGGSFGANPSRAIGYTVNGASPNTNSTRIDGTSSTDFNDAIAPMYTPALDAIANVNVVTGSYDAEQGVAGGAAVNVTTKSGSNQLHGSVFEYNANQGLQAYPWGGNAALPKPAYLNNQFGGTIGGPIKKGKLFYFVSYQGTYVTVGTTLYAENPTSAMLAGNLSASPTPIYDPATGNPNGTGRTAFPGNIIPEDRIDPGIKALLNLAPWPAPNTAGTGTLGLARNYRSTGTSSENQNQFDTKLSWAISSKLSMFARFGLDMSSWINPQQYGMLGGAGYSPSNSATGSGQGKIYSGTLSGTYIATPHLVADAYYGYTRNNANADQELLSQNLSYTVLGIPGLESSQTRQGGLPVLAIDGFGGTGSNIPEATLGPANNFEPQVYGNDEKEWVGNVTWVKGNHNVRGGVDFDQQQDNEDFELATFCSYCAGAGGFQFSQGATQLNGGPAGNDYNAFASFLLGLPANAGRVALIPPDYHDYANILGFYVRDQWQITPRFTLTLGTRWDYYPFATRGGRGMEYLDAQTNQMIICGMAGVPENCGITKDDQRFEPRVGGAYKLNEATVLRAGYAMSTDPTNIGGVVGNRENYPDVDATTLPAPNSFSYGTTLRLGLPPVSVPNYSSGSVAVPLTTGVFTVDNNTYVRGYIESWNVTLERQIREWLTSASYVATRSIDPISGINANWGTIGTGTAGQVLTLLSGRTASTTTIGTFGNAKYDSLQTRIGHSFARNYEASAAYTWGHGMGYTSQVAIPADYYRNYGNTAGVARQTLGATVMVASPFGKNQHWMTSGLESKVLGGWQLEGISVFRTGTPFTATASNTTLNASGSTQFADCIGKPQKLGDIHQWYSTADFANPTTGRFGTCSTNSLFGPGYVNLDTSLSRTFNLLEHYHLEARAELFNTSNTPHHANPSSSLSSSNFMQATGIANTGRDGIDQRTAEVSLRMTW
jgi:hypothetical protein